MKTKKQASGKTTLKISSLLEKGRSSEMPVGVKPMLATLVNEPFDDPAWSYEVKWDGYRALAYIS